MASASWSTETDEKINFTKLCRLLVDGGTQAVRLVFDGIHPPSSLKTILNANKTTLKKLKKPKGKVLNNEQWDQLYPPSGSDPKSEDFDITLLFVLLRNICGLTAPATGWDALPPVTDPSKEANLAWIKYYRNNAIAHKSSAEISDADFEQLWQDISSALLSLGLSQDDIGDLKSAPLGKKDYNQLLDDWYVSDKDIKTQLEEVKSDTAAIREKLDDVTNMCMKAPKLDSQIQKLAFSDFKQEIDTKCKSFHPNTRQWILDRVKSHVDSDQPDSCIMLIRAGPGMGKSTLAAKICQAYKELGCLAGCHFFQFSNSTRNNPRSMLQSIARQMYDTVPGYGEALERKLQTHLAKQISEMNCEELLTILIEEPLCNVEQPNSNSNWAVVIDALDECSHDARDELLKALKKKLPCCPPWLRFIITSRPSTNTSVLGSNVTVEVKPEDPSNIKDLKVYFSCELKTLKLQSDHGDSADLVQKLVKPTKGLFLIGFFVIEYLKRENVTSLEKGLELFPNGISSVYENYFSRLKKVLMPYISEEERFYKMLEAIASTNNPMPKTMFYNILGLKSNHEVPRQERKPRKDAMDTLHSLLPVEKDHVTPFHKSVIDWLTLQEDQDHDFSVRVEDGDEVLATQCNDALNDIRNGEKDLDKPLNLTDSEKYALGFLCHLVKKRSSVVEADKYGFFSNIFLLNAAHIENIDFLNNYIDIISVRGGIVVFKILDCLASFIRTIKRHDPSCRFFCAPPFGCYLALVLQFAHVEEVVHLTPKPIEDLKKYRFPYFDKDRLFMKTPERTKSVSNKHRVQEDLYRPPQRYLFNCKDGFIAVDPSSYPPPPVFIHAFTIYKFALDGCLIRQEMLPCGELCIAASPTVNFIVAADEYGKRIKILDATTLQVVNQYKSPHDAIQTCHVFGDDQGCFIVVKGCYDSKVYVIEGLTGQVHNTITVTEDSTVMDVSCQGLIVLTRGWRSQEICLYHYECDRAREPIIIRPLEEKTCFCSCTMSELKKVEALHGSADGCLLAYHYGDSIFIVNTSDGSLFKRWPLGMSSGSWLDILFVSRSYLVIIEGRFLFVINIQTDDVEHRMYVPCVVRSNAKQYLLFPKAEGKSFDLIYTLLPSEVSRLVFHNSNLQGLHEDTRPMKR